MNGIKSIGLIICMLMVLMAYLKQIIPKGKTALLMKTILSVFILLAMVEGILKFDFSKIKSMLDTEYGSSLDSWNETVGLIEDGLIDEMNRFLAEQKIYAKVIKISISGDYELFEVQNVILGGKDAKIAKTIVSSRYQIDQSNIEVKNE